MPRNPSPCSQPHLPLQLYQLLVDWRHCVDRGCVRACVLCGRQPLAPPPHPPQTRADRAAPPPPLPPPYTHRPCSPVIVVGFIFVGVKGLNWGVDYSAGTTVQTIIPPPYDYTCADVISYAEWRTNSTVSDCRIAEVRVQGGARRSDSCGTKAAALPLVLLARGGGGGGRSRAAHQPSPEGPSCPTGFRGSPPSPPPPSSSLSGTAGWPRQPAF